jgi:hypothetical protein
VAEIQGLAGMDDALGMSERQPTGDHAVDEVLGKLDAAGEEPLDTQIAVIEQVHQVLQGRLADLGQE